VVVQLKEALNTVWDVPEKKSGGVLGFIKTRVVSFAFVLGVGFILLVSLLLSTFLSAAGKFLGGIVPMPQLLEAINFVVSLGVITVLLAMIYKFLPDIKLPWKDVWLGAATTAVLFTIGKFALGLYLGRSSVASMYGAAGSIIVVLVWVYYSAQILFFGAELTQVYSRTYGSWKGTVKRTQREKDCKDQLEPSEKDATPGDLRKHAADHQLA
jgi:membrane protein